jgi:hypothetical protein
MKGNIKPGDTRYKDPQNLIMGNAIMAGMLPWAQAAADVAAGRVPMEKFDEVRMEHQRRIEELKSQHPDFANAAEKAVPFLEGLGMGVMKPGKTIAGTMARGAAVTAPQGAARGYSSGPVEEPSGSTERAGRAVGGAVTDAAIGAGGAAVPALVQGAKSLVGKTTSLLAERAARKSEAAAAQKLDEEARTAADAVAVKKAGTAAKTAETKRLKGLDKQYEARLKTENDQISSQYKRYNEQPTGPSQYWQENRAHFISDPIENFNRAAEHGVGLEGWARALNLPQSVILSRMSGKKVIVPEGSPHEKLFREMLEADRVGQEFTKRGLASGVSGSTSGPAGTAGGSTTSPAGKPRAKPSARQPASTSDSSRSGWSPADIQPYAEPPAGPKPKRKSKPKP